MILRFHDSLFAGHLGVFRTVYRLHNRVYWPGLHQDVRSYLASCTVCLARKSPCPQRAPMDMCSKYGFCIIIPEGIIDYTLILCYL